MAVVRRVRREAQSFAGAGAVSAPSPLTGAALDAIGSAVAPIAADAIEKVDMRASQRMDIDYMRAGQEYERQVADIEMAEGGEGYVEKVAEVFAGTFGKVKAPEHRAEEDRARKEKLAVKLEGQAQKTADKEAADLSVFNLGEAVDGLQAEVSRNPAAIEGARKTGNRLIDENPDLNNKQKRAAKDKFNEGLDEAAELARVKSDPVVAKTYAGTVKATDLIRQKEGFRSKPYNDPQTDKNGKQVGPNIYRGGYGSDTITTADGRVVKVTKDTVVTRADAERDLARREQAFRKTAIGNIGKAGWDKLPPNAQAALVSITYNYGEIPKRIREAARSGNVYALAEAVEGLSGDNGGINKKRRMQEAEIIRGGKVNLSAAAYRRVSSAAARAVADGARVTNAQKSEALDLADDVIAAYEMGYEVIPEGLTEAQLGMLSRSKREAYLDAPYIAQARDLGSAAQSQEEVAAIIKSLQARHDPSRAQTLTGEVEDAFSDKEALVKRAEKEEVAARQAYEDSVMEMQAGLTVAMREDLIARTDGALQKKLQSAQKRFISGLGSDQVELMREGGQHIPALDGENLMVSLKERAAKVSGYAKNNGVEPIILAAGERTMLSSEFEKMDLQGKIGFVTELSSDAEIARLVFPELSESAPFLSHSGGMLNNGGNADAVFTAMKGMQATADGMKFSDVTKADRVAAMGDDFKEAVRGVPALQGIADKFATNYARGKSTENGGIVDPNDYADGLLAAIGEIYRYNPPGVLRGARKAMILPPNVSGGEMRGFLNGLSDDLLRGQNEGEMPVDATGVDIDAEYIRENADYLTIGPGVYIVEFDGEPALAKDGQPFVLEFEK